MSPTEELSELFRQWRSLTEDEGFAIESGAWNQVEGCQSAKSRLQPRITELSQRVDATTHDRQFRPMVEELMQLERRNGSLLQQKRSDAHEQQQSLDRSQRNLRQIQKSYLPPARMHWQSYS